MLLFMLLFMVSCYYVNNNRIVFFQDIFFYLFIINDAYENSDIILSSSIKIHGKLFDEAHLFILYFSFFPVINVITQLIKKDQLILSLQCYQLQKKTSNIIDNLKFFLKFNLKFYLELIYI